MEMERTNKNNTYNTTDKNDEFLFLDENWFLWYDPIWLTIFHYSRICCNWRFLKVHVREVKVKFAKNSHKFKYFPSSPEGFSYLAIDFPAILIIDLFILTITM